MYNINCFLHDNLFILYLVVKKYNYFYVLNSITLRLSIIKKYRDFVEEFIVLQHKLYRRICENNSNRMLPQLHMWLSLLHENYTRILVSSVRE